METRANYALIGLFTLVVIAAGFGFVYWFSGKDARSKLANYQIVFNGSVSGLSRGSLVLYNGLRVGEVTSLGLQPNDPGRVVAIIAVDSNTPMNTDTRARLEFQGLTGVASIALSGGGPVSRPLTSSDGQPPIIAADRSDFQDLIESASRIAAKADDVLSKVQKVVDENQGGITSIVKNVDSFTRALGENSEGIGKFLASVGTAADNIAALSVRLETLTDGVDAIVRAVDPQEVKSIVANVREVTATLSAERERISAFVTQASELATKLNGSAGRLDSLLASADTAVKSLDVAKIGRTVDNVDKFATALGNNSPQVDQIVRNTNELVAKLNQSADRLDDVLAGAQSFLGSGDGKGAFAEVGETAKSIRRLADNLDQRTAEITAGIGRITGRGLQSLEAFANDGRKTLNDVSKTLRNLEKNPQQLLFGGRPSIPEYNGRP
jgi:phospholipid/cholesterol/gamma-HCH transport system substrate-binding protein